MINKTFPIAEKLLTNGLQLSQTLFQRLQEETDILRRKQPALFLDTITRQKQQLISELNLFAKQLGQVLETEKLPNNRNGIIAYLEKAANAGLDTSQVLNQWGQINELAIQSQSLNDQNGATIDLLLRHTRQSLNILKGKPQAPQTYGPDGTTKSDLYSSTLFSV